MNKFCTSCKEEKDVKYFSKRTGKNKMVGKNKYLAHCNSCKAKKVPTAKQSPIDKKWLVRGIVSNEGGNGFTQFTQE